MMPKLIFGAALCVLTLGTASAQYPQQPGQPYPPQPLPTQPQPYPTQPAPRPAHFHVMYRICEFEPWELYGNYDCHEQSHRAARTLERRGYQVKVVHH